jgi:hypothetical protein
MLFHNDGSLDADPGMPSKADVAPYHHWNLWKTQRQAYAALDEDTPVVLVDTWPGGSRLTWEGMAVSVLKRQYRSKPEAVRLIAKHLGLTQSQVRSNDYTKEKPDVGYMLVWRFTPTRPVDLYRPVDMKIGRDGYLVQDDPVVLSGWGLSPPSPPLGVGSSERANGTRGGQGRLTLAEKVVVERHAMARASAWCKKEGWPIVENVSSHKSWDLEARKKKGGPPLFVEVKGTIGAKPDVEVTVAEVKHALANSSSTVFAVVTEIKLDRTPPKPKASGGTLHVHNPWGLRMSELDPLTYRWSRP